jgi:hypothetical protein
METLKGLESLGITLPSPLYIAGAILFGVIGMAAYWYGKKAKLPVPKWIGVVLMLYPYVVSDTWLLYVVGAGLSIAAYFFRAQEF